PHCTPGCLDVQQQFRRREPQPREPECGPDAHNHRRARTLKQIWVAVHESQPPVALQRVLYRRQQRTTAPHLPHPPSPPRPTPFPSLHTGGECRRPQWGFGPETPGEEPPRRQQRWTILVHVPLPDAPRRLLSAANRQGSLLPAPHVCT